MSGKQKFSSVPRLCLLLAIIVVITTLAVELFGSSDYLDELHDRVSGPSEGRGLKVVSGIRYGNPPDAIKEGDLYLPARSSAKLPCIVFLHGGSWRKGRRHDMDIWAQVLAANGFAVFNIDTRLIPTGGGFPRDIVDVRDAVCFISRHADEYGIDANLIGTAGHSSGGHVALMAAYAPYDGALKPADYPDCSARVKFVASVSGVTDLLDPELVDFSDYVNNVPRDSANASLYESASPLHYANRAVPTVLIHGTKDKNVPFEQAQRLSKQLTKYKIPSHLLAIEGGGHLYFGRSVRIAMSAIAEFFRKEFSSVRPGSIQQSAAK